MNQTYTPSESNVRETAEANNLLYALYQAGRIVRSDEDADLLTSSIEKYVLGRDN